MTTANDLLTDAQQIKALANSSEPRRRTLVSRMYYAAYHQCLHHAQAKGYRFDGTDGLGRHESLLKFLRTHSDPALSLAGRVLSTMRLRRVQADYHLQATLSMQDFQDTEADCEEVLFEILA